MAIGINYLYPGHLETFADFVKIFAKTWKIVFEVQEDGINTLVFQIPESPFMGYITIESDRAQVGIRVGWPMTELGDDGDDFNGETEIIANKLMEHLSDKGWHKDQSHIFKDFGKLDANREDWFKAGQMFINTIGHMKHNIHNANGKK
jgi:hypothetical protein